jgi:hypothetical protein
MLVTGPCSDPLLHTLGGPLLRPHCERRVAAASRNVHVATRRGAGLSSAATTTTTQKLTSLLSWPHFKPPSCLHGFCCLITPAKSSHQSEHGWLPQLSGLVKLQFGSKSPEDSTTLPILLAVLLTSKALRPHPREAACSSGALIACRASLAAACKDLLLLPARGMIR